MWCYLMSSHNYMNKNVDKMVYLNSCYLRGIGRGNFYAKMNANNVNLLSLKCSNTFFTFGHARPVHYMMILGFFMPLSLSTC